MFILDVAFKISMVLIAAFNAYYIIMIRDNKDAREKEKDRKINLLKILVLDHNLKGFYSVIEDIQSLSNDIVKEGLTNDQKAVIFATIQGKFIELRRNFYDPLLGVDKVLYNAIQKCCDELQDSLSISFFDEGVKLSHPPKFEELILNKIALMRTNIIQLLFSYRG